MQRNGILARLSRAELEILRPHLEPVSLPRGKQLERRARKIEYVYFLIRGIASVVADSNARGLEVGLIGREGVTGLASMMGAERAPYEVFMQTEGEAFAISASHLRAGMERSAHLRDVLLRFGHIFQLQVAATAVAGGRGKIGERLARWLLMAHDRIEGDALPVTHEFLATMLGVRRPGVSEALKLLEKKGLIQTDRRTIIIHDRAGLEKNAFAYGTPEAEYRRLFG